MVGYGRARVNLFALEFVIDRETRFLLPPSVDEWLPETHLARFVVEVIERLELSTMVGSYRGCTVSGTVRASAFSKMHYAPPPRGSAARIEQRWGWWCGVVVQRIVQCWMSGAQSAGR